jgi:hypothetical protein
MARIATADRFLITVSSMAGPWDSISGQEVTRDVPTMRQLAGGPKVAMPSRPEYGNVTLTRLWDQDRDGDIFRKIAKGTTYADSSITVQELDADGNVIPGAATVYGGCVVVSAQHPDGDANSGDTAKLTVVFSVSSVA